MIEPFLPLVNRPALLRERAAPALAETAPREQNAQKIQAALRPNTTSWEPDHDSDRVIALQPTLATMRAAPEKTTRSRAFPNQQMKLNGLGRVFCQPNPPRFAANPCGQIAGGDQGVRNICGGF